MDESKYRQLAKAAIAFVVLGTLFFSYQVTQIGFDYDFEKFFPQDDPETDYFLAHREKFSSENDFVLFSLVNEEGIFDLDFLKEARRLQDSLEALPYVVSVQSLLNLEEPIIDPVFGSVFQRPFLRYDKPEHYTKDSARIFSSPELINSFVTEDGQAMALLLNHQPLLSKAGCDTLAWRVENTVTHFEFDQLYKSGRSIGQGYFVKRMQMELIIFVSASLILIITFLFIAFRSIWGVVVPLIVVFCSVIWLVGVMHVTGKEVDLLLTILPTILFVVGMSDVVHILSKYFDELRKGRPKMEAIKVSVKEVGIATFLTSLTTSIGFLTLMSSSIMPIRDFGIYSSVGVLLAYILAFTLLPAVMVLSKPPSLRREKKAEDFWTPKLHTLYMWVISHRRAIGWGSIVLVGICAIGISRIEVNNYLLEELAEDNPMKVEFNYFEKEYSGMRPFEMAFEVTDTSKTIFDPEILRGLDALDEYLRTEYGAGFLVSPLNFVKNLNKATHSGNADYYRLPEKDGQVNKLTNTLKRAKNMKEFQQFVTPDLRESRVAGKMGDWGKIEIEKRNEALAEYWETSLGHLPIQYHITGTATLIDLNNQYLSTTMMWGLFIAFLIVAIIVGLMYRDLKMVIIALIPNMLPLMMIAAVMGFFDIDLKVSTSIIFTIAFGIAVDDTIHFVSRMRLELAKGRSRQYALKRAFIGTGKAIIITSLILVAGFLTLIISTFNGTFYTGALLSLTLFFAVAIDLLLIPVLFWAFFGREEKTSGEAAILG